MGQREIRDGIATILEGVSITQPVAETIKHVYKTPPGSLQDVPCFVIYPPARKPIQRAWGMRIVRYQWRCRLFVQGEEIAEATDIVDAYSEATLDAFDTAMTLNTTASALDDQDNGEVEVWKYGGKNYVGFDCLLTAIVHEAKELQT